MHMASHIDVLVGDYEAAIEANKRAIVADEKCMECCRERCGAGSFYQSYMCHDFHMLIYAAILGGFEQEALSAARRLRILLSEEVLASVPEAARDGTEAFHSMLLNTPSFPKNPTWHRCLRLRRHSCVCCSDSPT